jgi:cytochrome c oxidase subunit 1
MDGDGSIQVNHWRYKILQYRLVIKLKYCSENLKMLNLISSHIGGRVRIIGENKFVIWVVDNRKQIHKIIKIFIKYPPLTSRLRAQLAFMLECLSQSRVATATANPKQSRVLLLRRGCFAQYNVDWYLNARDKKYLNYNGEILNIDNSYFNEWLSGFIEAVGSFSIRTTSNNNSFSIGQNDDKIILDKIKNHFNITNQVRKINDRFWFIEVYKKSTLINIINHCIEYPLLGEKILPFTKFRDLF